MLVFTCHEHIAALFRGLKAPVRELPSNAHRDPAPLIFDDTPKEKPKKPARPSSTLRKGGGSHRTAEMEETAEAAEAPATESQPVLAVVEPSWEEVEPSFEDSGEVWEEE